MLQVICYYSLRSLDLRRVWFEGGLLINLVQKYKILISTIFWAMMKQIRLCLLILLGCKIGVKHLKTSIGKQARMQRYQRKVRWNWWGWKNLREWSCFTRIGYQLWWCASFDSVCYRIEVKLNVYLKRRTQTDISNQTK